MTDTLPTDVELRPIDELVPYVNNPKDHPEHQIDKIVSSIKNYGFDQPIVVDGAGEIIKGHGRHAAANKLGLDRVPVIVRTDLTDAEVRAARIADNKTSLESGWDIDTLAIELDTLRDEPGFDIEDTGFDPDEAEAMIDSVDFDIDEFFEDEEPTNDTDGTPEIPGDEEVECPHCGETFWIGEDLDGNTVESP